MNDAARSAGGKGAQSSGRGGRSPDERQRNPGPSFKLASRSRISLRSSGPQTAKYSPSPPRAPAVRDLPPGGKQNCCRGAISRPSFAHGGEWRTARSPDERQRNPGPAFKRATRSRISLSLSSGRATSGQTRWFHPGYKLVQREGRRNAGRRNRSIGRICGCGARPAGRARRSAFRRGSCLGDPTPPLSSGHALPGTQPRRVLPALNLSQSSELLADRS